MEGQRANQSTSERTGLQVDAQEQPLQIEYCGVDG